MKVEMVREVRGFGVKKPWSLEIERIVCGTVSRPFFFDAAV